jgi:hypothetical protein
MSLWIPRRDSDGRLYWYSVSVPIVALVPALAICLVLLVDLARNAPLKSLTFFAGMLLLGFAAFLSAKVSVYQTGFWFSFGSGRMTPGMRRFYRLGYSLMVPAAIMTLLLSLLVVRLHG